MKNKKSILIKNQRGNALPFVIVIGLILMLLVASLISVAIGGISFTQSSVESRQAYIDAKSVTEYGRFLIEQEINNMKATPLPDKTAANEMGDSIYYIQGTRSNPTEPLVFNNVSSTAPSIIGVVKMKWKPTVVTGDDENKTATTAYTFSVESQNLRRKLDYETSFNYVVSTQTTQTPTYPGVPTPPQKPTVNPISFGTQTTIFINDKDLLECDVNAQGHGIGHEKEKDGVLTVIPNYARFEYFDINLTGFDFKQQKKLELAANQIAVSVPMPNVYKPTYIFGLKNGNTFLTQLLDFEKGYTPGGTETVTTMKAKNVIIKGDLNLAWGSTLDIDCENLWITGNVNLNNQTRLNKIKATNIFIKENLYLQDKTSLEIDCPNIWLGSMTSGATEAELVVKNVQYFKSGTMQLNDKIKLTITGAPNISTNQVEVGSIDAISTGQQINISNLYSFNCLSSIAGSWSNASISIQSKIVTIGGDLSLVGINGNNSKITTQYFICAGNTLLQQITGTFRIGDSTSATGCIQFAQGYNQIESDVSLYGGRIIQFNGNYQMGNWSNRKIILSSDNIYFYSDMINTANNTVVSNGVTETNAAKVFLKTASANPTRTAGKYIGYTTNALDNATLIPGDFTLIPFPAKPGIESGGGTPDEEIVVSINNTKSVYY